MVDNSYRVLYHFMHTHVLYNIYIKEKKVVGEVEKVTFWGRGTSSSLDWMGPLFGPPLTFPPKRGHIKGVIALVIS